MSRITPTVPLALWCAATMSTPAWAQTATVVDDEEAPPPVVLRHIPPRFSWEFGISVGYGMLTQFPEAPSGIGFGLRAGWGKHFGAHRVGAGLSITFEGAIPVQWSNNFEPAFVWDFIVPDTKGLFLGLSAGPDLILNVDSGATRNLETDFTAAPSLAFRIGYSQPWSLVARRFWVVVEPKVRIINGNVNVIGAIVLGSGNGY